MKQLIVCADDYAQNEHISSGIRALYRAGRINAVSCMTQSPYFECEGEKLRALNSKGRFGLHFNLTEGQPLSDAWRSEVGSSFRSLGYLWTHMPSAHVIRQEFVAQWRAFEKVMGQKPQFVDGHQHIHQYYRIRTQILNILTEHDFKGMVRVSWHQPWMRYAFFKTMLLGWMGGRVLKQALSTTSFLKHTSFCGVYHFHRAHHFPQYMNYFLSKSRDQGLIMCHPGHASSETSDPLYLSRPLEFDYFMSDAWVHALKTYGFSLE